jgi:hypothetical protein
VVSAVMREDEAAGVELMRIAARLDGISAERRW